MGAPNQYYRCLGYRETPEPVELSQAALHWWRTVASEEAIGRWMAERIRERWRQVAMASSKTVPV